MYGFSEFVPLTEEEILKRVNPEEIAEMALGYIPVCYQRMCSPLRPKDKSPGSWFEWHNGKYWFLDFGDKITHRIIFKFIADYYNVTFHDALKIVNKHFELGLGEDANVVIPKAIIYHNPAQHFNAEKQRSHIIYKPRPFVLKDKNYWWGRYKITKAQLIEDEVAALIWFKLYSSKVNKWVVNRPIDICYGYTEFKVRIKTYRPLSEPKFKWISNCDENDVGGLSRLPITGDKLFIKKAYKDYRVVKNQGANTIWVQNETCTPKDEILTDLCERFDVIYIWFDNDEAGIKGAVKLRDKINSLYPDKAIAMWLPETLLQEKIKDPSDLVHKKSEQALREFMIDKNLYGNNTLNDSSIMDTTHSAPF